MSLPNDYILDFKLMTSTDKIIRNDELDSELPVKLFTDLVA